MTDLSQVWLDVHGDFCLMMTSTNYYLDLCGMIAQRIPLKILEDKICVDKFESILIFL